MKHYLRRIITCMTIAVLLISGCALTAFADDTDALKSLQGKRAGVMTGTPQEDIIAGSISDVEYYYYNNYSDICLAISEGKIDFFAASTVNYLFFHEEYPTLRYYDVSLMDLNLGAIFPKTSEGEALRDQMNEYIAKINADGTLESLQDKWITVEDKAPIDLPTGGENGILKFATCSTMKPMSYIVDGKPAGLDIALIDGFCREYGYGVKLFDQDFQGVLSGIEAGKYDLAAAQISYTEERAESVLFSDAYYVQHIVPIYNDASAANSNDNKSFIERIKNSFEKTFIKDHRWQTILKGLGNTIALTLLATVIGTIIGYGVFALRTSRKKLAVNFAKIYIKVLQGTPMVVLLLIMYYLIFGKSDVPGFWVAVVAFALNFAAYVAEIIRSGVEGIDGGQREAALALGYTERQAFYFFVLPQAAVRFLPVLKGQIVALLKGTAVVGYIAILDLTRAGDIIRSSTYEAFFPLISTAIIYFALAWLLGLMLDRLEIKIDPRRNAVKGGK